MNKNRIILVLLIFVLIFQASCSKKSEYEKELLGKSYTSYAGYIEFQKDKILVYLYTDLYTFSEEERQEEINRRKKSGEIKGEIDEMYNEYIVSKNPRMENNIIKSESLPDLKIDDNGHIVYRDIDFIDMGH